MNQTLHLCNLDQISNISNYVDLVANYDTLVIIADKIDLQTINEINSNFENINVFYLSDETKSNNSKIDYIDMVELVNKHKRTFTWR